MRTGKKFENYLIFSYYFVYLCCKFDKNNNFTHSFDIFYAKYKMKDIESSSFFGTVNYFSIKQGTATVAMPAIFMAA